MVRERFGVPEQNQVFRRICRILVVLVVLSMSQAHWAAVADKPIEALPLLRLDGHANAGPHSSVALDSAGEVPFAEQQPAGSPEVWAAGAGPSGASI